MGGIFISYRRDDTQGEALHLFDTLQERFGRDRVFMDVTGIAPGLDFRQAIDEAVLASDLLIAMIGKQWLAGADASGARRLDDPDDFVRLETRTALNRKLPVIPVLVQGARMPRPEELPGDLEAFAWRNAFELRHNRWEVDVAELMKALEQTLPASPRRTWWRTLPGRLAIAAGLIATVAALVMTLSPGGSVWNGNGPDSQPATSERSPPGLAELEQRLQAVNIQLSTGGADETAKVRTFFTGPTAAYQLLAVDCLEILGNRRLKETGYLDMIDKWYTLLVGSERYVTAEGRLDRTKLREAIVKANNEYHGRKATAFEQVVE